jgi:hypothetical protein
MKKVRILTESGIQQILKDIITKEKLQKYFKRVITNESIESYLFLLNIGRDITDETEQLSRKQRMLRDKYVYDLLTALLYEEAISISEINNLFNREDLTDEEIRDIFEAMVIFEYDLYQLSVPVNTVSTNNDRKLYVRDLILNVYFGTKDRISYKDLSNLQSEVEKIFSSSNPPSTEMSSTALLLRINDSLAIAEKDEIYYYSFLINYNVNNKYFIRKSIALELNNELNTKAYYEKMVDGQKEIRYFNNIRELFYYPEYLLTENTIYSQNRQFLINYRNQLLKRTINYEE